MIKQTINSYFYYILGAGLAFTFQFLAAIYLGATEFGKANYYLGYALTIWTFTCFGVQFFLPKYLHQQSNPKKLVSETFWTISILYFIITPILYALLNDLPIFDFILVILLSYFMIVFGIFRAYYNGIFETQKSYYLYFLFQVISLIFFVLFILINSDYIVYLLAIIFAYLLVNIVEIYHLVGKNIKFNKKIISFSLSFYFVQISYGLFTSVSRILQKEFSSFEMVGILSVALVLGSVVSMFGEVIAQVIMPEFSKLWKNNDLKMITSIFHNATRMNVYIIIPIAIFSIVNSEKIIELFGKSYSGGGLILSIILFSSFFSSAVGPNGTLLNMSDNQHFEIFNGILGLICAFFIGIILGPKFVWGIALALAISEIIRNTAKAFEVKKIFGIWPFQKQIAKYVCVICLLEMVIFFATNKIYCIYLWILVNSLLILVFIVANYYFSPIKTDKYIFLVIFKYFNK